MSDLQALCQTLESVNRDADQLASDLAQRAQRLSQAATQAANAGRGTSRVEGAQAAQALQAASRSAQRAAQLLHQVSVAGRGFVSRNAGGGTGPTHGGASSSSGGTGAGFGAGAGRYVHPGAQQEARFSQLVGLFGTDNPEGWIGAGNPHYGSGLDMWTNNCGPCSRSFADTFHGKSASPALGDSKVPPGEYLEMWDAVGTQPTSKLTNSAEDSSAFSATAYQAIEQSLQREGPGAVAIIGVDWDVPGLPRGHGGGHWFNAYVDHDGTVKWADEQIGQTADWPPGYKTDVWQVEAVVRPSADSEWKELVL